MKNIQLLAFLLLILLKTSIIKAQPAYAKNGIIDNTQSLIILKNANIYTSYNQLIKGASISLKEGKIVTVSHLNKFPKHAIIIDMKGAYIYPGFIELNSRFGLPTAEKGNKPWYKPQAKSKKTGATHWNESIHPEYNSISSFTYNKTEAETLRKNGITAVLSHSKDGIMRGTSCLVQLSDETTNKSILQEKLGNHLSFSKGSSTQDYPNSLMGAIALIKQTYLDAKWYTNNKSTSKEISLSHSAISTNSTLPQFFETRNKLDILRANKIGKEYNKQFIYIGNGDEYQRINQLSDEKLIIPINFPKTPEIKDPYHLRQIPLSSLQHWELAPYNPQILHKNNISFAFTSYSSDKKSSFIKNIKTAIEKGLSPEHAIKALTITPAQYIGKENELGKLAPNFWANMVVLSAPIQEKKSKITEVWVKGKKFVIENHEQLDLKGDYDLLVDNNTFDLTIKSPKKGELKVSKEDTIKYPVNIQKDKQTIWIQYTDAKNPTKGFSLHGKINDNAAIFNGNGQLSNGKWIAWNAIKKKTPSKEKKKNTPKKDTLIPPTHFPLGAHGILNPQKQQPILIKNATLWTNEDLGIIEQTDILIEKGLISQIGKNISYKKKDLITIDATGKHVTPGIIDEHSHIAIEGGVNECTQASTAEVSIGDVVRANDINVYRQLAGGVTAAQLLHGSCNPIGGRSALIKLKWGASPEEMKIHNAPKFIKFALGENVKRSNFGDFHKQRFPQTRMGVEQFYIDAFTRAVEYEKKKAASPESTAPDLELEFINEIINKERFISCHSYQQSEINMLMKVTEQFGFKVNTFTHILEGYKVADKMKKHGAGGSTFSDWWAYKFEVNDAIPYNAPIMHNQGIVTALNSDDAEMARRLNQEAGKMVKYGNISEEDALKMVTLNPAKLLHLDDRMGSLKIGKDADIVIWSKNPLSVYSKAETTIIEGRIYFDIKKDKLEDTYTTQEKQRLFRKIQLAKQNGAETAPAKINKQPRYHCDSVEEGY